MPDPRVPERECEPPSSIGYKDQALSIRQLEEGERVYVPGNNDDHVEMVPAQLVDSAMMPPFFWVPADPMRDSEAATSRELPRTLEYREQSRDFSSIMPVQRPSTTPQGVLPHSGPPHSPPPVSTKNTDGTDTSPESARSTQRKAIRKKIVFYGAIMLCILGVIIALVVAMVITFAGTNHDESNNDLDVAPTLPPDLTVAPSFQGPLDDKDETIGPTPAVSLDQTVAPTSQNSKLCMTLSSEIRHAVDLYLLSPSDEVLLDTYGPLEDWCVSDVTNFDSLFDADRNPLAASFDADISRWDMSNAESLFAMLDGAAEFDQDLSGWDVGNVINFGFMFDNCTRFNSDLSAWE